VASLPRITAAVNVLAHTPGLVPRGSKPTREIAARPGEAEAIARSLRGFAEAVAYPPHQVFIGNLRPEALDELPRPWYGVAEAMPTRGQCGEIVPEETFWGLLRLADEFDLVGLSPEAAGSASQALKGRVGLPPLDKLRGGAPYPTDQELDRRQAVFFHDRQGRPVGWVKEGYAQDESLTPAVVLENLATKASAALAVQVLAEQTGLDLGSVPFMISCSEEAVGDRYQRGGGNMAKAIAEMVGASNASGFDVKNFCAAPLPALVTAGAYVQAGIFPRVLVVAGGSLPKLGMKYQGHLKVGSPILEDILGGIAVLVEKEGNGPALRLDALGRVKVAHKAANEMIMRALVAEPLAQLGLRFRDVDKYAAELHNPEITEPQGSGNVPLRNYRMIGVLALRDKQIAANEVEPFVKAHGMPGFAPTQGHIASAICYVPEALRRFREGQAKRVLLLAKGSLFLGKMSQLSDGMSVLLEA